MTESSVRLADAARLDVALDRLVTSGRLTADQAVAVRGEFAATTGAIGPAGAVNRPGTGPALPAPSWRVILPEIGGYLGAAFVVAASVVLVGPHWDALSRVGQVLLFAVPAEPRLFRRSGLIHLGGIWCWRAWPSAGSSGTCGPGSPVTSSSASSPWPRWTPRR